LAKESQKEMREFVEEAVEMLEKVPERKEWVQNDVFDLLKDNKTQFSLDVFGPLKGAMDRLSREPSLKGKFSALIGWENSFIPGALVMGYPPKKVTGGVSIMSASLFGGGASSNDRSFIDCLKREFNEESGLQIPQLFDETGQRAIASTLGVIVPDSSVYICFYSPNFNLQPTNNSAPTVNPGTSENWRNGPTPLGARKETSKEDPFGGTGGRPAGGPKKDEHKKEDSVGVPPGRQQTGGPPKANGIRGGGAPKPWENKGNTKPILNHDKPPPADQDEWQTQKKGRR